MKDPQSEIQQAFYTALNATITYNGETIYFYAGLVPEVHPTHFIHMIGSTVNDAGTKDRFLTECTISFEVVGEFQPLEGTYAGIHSISNQILQKLKPTTASVLTMTNFYMITLVPDGSNTFEEITDRDRIIRKVMNFRMLVEEK